MPTPNLLASGKTYPDKYENGNPGKNWPALDMGIIAAEGQNSAEETQGFNYSGNEGSLDAQVENLSIIDPANANNYIGFQSKIIQTYVANASQLAVDPSSTPNSIILIPRTISSRLDPNGVNQQKPASFPFYAEDNLKFIFRAMATTTGATVINIVGLSGITGAVQVIDEQGIALGGGEIIANNFYSIILTTIGGIRKIILETANFISATTSKPGIVYLNSPITIANNAGAPNTAIDCSAGTAQFSDGSGQLKVSALTKTTAAFVAGNNQGGLLAGSVAANSTYHWYVIYNPTTLVFDFACIVGIANTPPDPSPVLPAGFTKFERIGSILTDGSTNILPFTQCAKNFILKTRINSISITSAITAGTTYSIAAPVGIKTLTNLAITANFTSNQDVGISIMSPSETFTPTATNSDIRNVLSGNVAEFASSLNKNVLTDTSSQIIVKSSAAASFVNLSASVLGWTDYQLQQ